MHLTASQNNTHVYLHACIHVHTGLVQNNQLISLRRKGVWWGGCGSDDGKKLIPVSKVKTRQWGSVQSSAGQLTSTGSLVKHSLPSVIQGLIIQSVDYPGHMLLLLCHLAGCLASLLINGESTQNTSVPFCQTISVTCTQPSL